MYSNRRLLGGMTGASLFIGAVAAGCAGVDTSTEEATGTAKDAIIAGVDAKSGSLNAVGALVEIYRYTYCPYPYNCGTGGSTGGGSAGGSSGIPPTTGIAGKATAPISTDVGRARFGHLDRLSPRWATGGTTGASSTPTTGKGGTTTRPTAVGGKSGMAGAAGATIVEPIEVVEYWPFCSGTLIGPTAVMSAKHCLQNLDYYGDSVEVGFAVGPDSYHPVAVYPIVDWDWESEVPPDYNSLLGDLGSDVGVAHLSAPAEGVNPLAVGTLSDVDVGARFTALGYGVQNNYETHGTRKAGSVTLRGIGGNYADYAFGGLEGFLKAAKSMPDFQGLDDWYLEDLYYRLGLIPEYQAFFGGKRGDAQPCFGDSGGPIIAIRDGVRTVFGNITSGFGSSRLICDFGVVAAIFGPLTQSYLEESLLWTDPCEGVTVKGFCSGDLAVRCTNRSEGKRRLSETDCSLIDQTCGVDESGAVACVDPPAIP